MGVGLLRRHHSYHAPAAPVVEAPVVSPTQEELDAAAEAQAKAEQEALVAAAEADAAQASEAKYLEELAMLEAQSK